MAAIEDTNEPIMAVENEDMEDAYERYAKPTEKSGVIPKPNAPASDPLFSKGEAVRISELVGSMRVRGSYQVHKIRWSKSKGYNEYQLIEPLTQVLHNNGAWIREKEIRRDRR